MPKDKIVLDHDTRELLNQLKKLRHERTALMRRATMPAAPPSTISSYPITIGEIQAQLTDNKHTNYTLLENMALQSENSATLILTIPALRTHLLTYSPILSSMMLAALARKYANVAQLILKTAVLRECLFNTKDDAYNTQTLSKIAQAHPHSQMLQTLCQQFQPLTVNTAPKKLKPQAVALTKIPLKPAPVVKNDGPSLLALAIVTVWLETVKLKNPITTFVALHFWNIQANLKKEKMVVKNHSPSRQSQFFRSNQPTSKILTTPAVHPRSYTVTAIQALLTGDTRTDHVVLLNIAQQSIASARLILTTKALRTRLFTGDEREVSAILRQIADTYPDAEMVQILCQRPAVLFTVGPSPAAETLQSLLTGDSLKNCAMLLNIAAQSIESAQLILTTDSLRTQLLIGDEDTVSAILHTIANAHADSEALQGLCQQYAPVAASYYRGRG